MTWADLQRVVDELTPGDQMVLPAGMHVDDELPADVRRLTIARRVPHGTPCPPPIRFTVGQRRARIRVRVVTTPDVQ